MVFLLSRKRHDSRFGSHPPACMEESLVRRLRLGSGLASLLSPLTGLAWIVGVL